MFWTLFLALECSLVPMQGRVDCSSIAGTEASCVQDGCCYEITSQAGIPHCYYPAGKQPTKQNLSRVE